MLTSKSISHIVSALVVLTLLLTGSPVQAARYAPSAAGMPDPFTGCNNQSQIPLAECEALVTFYNSTDGPNWNMYTQWLQTNTPCGPALWFGVTCADGHVTQLQLGGRNLTGSIPPELANLTELEKINLSENYLSGVIPPQLGTLTQLKNLDLKINGLTGSIPPTLGNLTQLQTLDLYDNDLTGSIPPELGNLAQLTYLRMDFNQLSGTLPPELGNLTELTSFGVYNNQLTGSIPPELGNLSKLSNFALAHNLLTGSIPPELGSLTELHLLYLNSNPLSGPLPGELGNLTKLHQLLLDDTQLSGEIPASFTNLTSLADLSLPCGLTSTNPTVISFTDQFIGKRLSVTWNNGCPALTPTPTVTPTKTATPTPTMTKTRTLIVATLPSIAAHDGWVLESSENSNVGGSINSFATVFRLGDDAAKKEYRSILSFNTASIPDTAIITGVTLKIDRHSTTGGINPLTGFQGFIADVKTGFFGTAAALQTADFQATASKTISPANPTKPDRWYNINLINAKTFINKLSTNDGLTQIRLRFKLGNNNNNTANYLNFYSSNTAHAAAHPQLVIMYYVP